MTSFGASGIEAEQVNKFHERDDVDIVDTSHHHTLGINNGQASPGPHIHDGKTSKKIAWSNLTGAPQAGTTVVDGRALGQAPVVGVSTDYSRKDHNHGSPFVPLIVKGSSTSALVATGTEAKDTGVGDLAFSPINGASYQIIYKARGQASVAVPIAFDWRLRYANSPTSPGVASTQLLGASGSLSVLGGGGAMDLILEEIIDCPGDIAVGNYLIAAFYALTAGGGNIVPNSATAARRQLSIVRIV